MSSVCFKCNGLFFLRLVDCSVSYTPCGEIMRYKMAAILAVCPLVYPVTITARPLSLVSIVSWNTL